MDVGTIAELESETARLEKAKADMKTALEEKGETVPAEESISTYAQHISNISGNEQNVLVNADFQNFLTFSEGETFWGFGPRGIFAPGWEKGGNTSVEVVPEGLKIGFQSERGIDVYFTQKFKPEFRVNNRSKKVKVEIVINGKLYTNEFPGGPDEASGVVYEITEENLRLALYPGKLNIFPIKNSAAGFYKIINNIRVIPVVGMDYYIDPDLNRLQSIGYNPETVTEQMTQPVGVKNGKFFTKPDAVSKISGAKPGDLIKVKTVDASGVPTALERVGLSELEGKWELIETLVMKEEAYFTRTYEDKNFKAIRIALVNNSGKFSEKAMGCNTNAGNGDLFVSQNKYNLAVIEPKNGSFEFTSYTGFDQYRFSNPIINGYDKLGVDPPTESPKVNKIYSYGAIKADTTIKIWAVRT